MASMTPPSSPHLTGRIGSFLALLAVLIFALSPQVRQLVLGTSEASLASDRGTDAPQRLDDRIGLIPLHDHERMNWYLGELERETAIDVRLLFARPPAGQTLERFAAAEASRLGIGRQGSDLRGLLFVYDPAGERLRVEVGYGLEEYFPDSFLGYLIENHLETFFRAGDPTTGLRLMIRILHERIRDQMLGGRFDPTPFARRSSSEYVSGGGGASGATPLSTERMEAFRNSRDGFRVPFDPVRNRHFRAQPTPEAAFQRYLEWLATGRFDPDLELFTPESRIALAQLPITPAYFDHVLMLQANRRYRIVERGEWAMLYFTSTPLVSPMFFRRSNEGWQVDTIEEVRNSREIVGGHYTWTLIGQGESFSRFADLFVMIGRFQRVADGDNRPLPLPGSQSVPAPVPLRALPTEVLAEPELPERDEFGYPRIRMDRREVIRLLRDARYRELEAILREQQRRTAQDFRYELDLREAYSAFERSDADLEPLLDEWLVRHPHSPEAHLARGYHYLARAWDARGTAFLRDTPHEKRERMRSLVRLATEDGAAALRLDSRQLMGYSLLIRVTQLSGRERDARELLRRGLEVSPYSFLLRSNLMTQLVPKWGGSYRKMQALAEEAETFATVNPRLRLLHGSAHRARGDELERDKQREAAIAEYTAALSYGENWSVRLDRGQAYYRIKEYEQALDDLNRAWMQRPQEPAILEWRGRTYYRLAVTALPAQRSLLLERTIRDLSLAHELEPTENRAKWLKHVRTCQRDPMRCG